MSRSIKVAQYVFVIAIALVLTNLSLPSPIHATAFVPTENVGFVGPYAKNNMLLGAEKLAELKIVRPTAVAVDDHDNVFVATADSKIIRMAASQDRAEVFVETHGTPMGLAFSTPRADGERDLYVADSTRGLLRVDPKGVVEVLVNEVEGAPFRGVVAVAVGRSGRVYFTDLADGFGISQFEFSMLNLKAQGRLLVYDPSNQHTGVLARNLVTPYGVAISRDESFVLISETGVYRITRMFITGERMNTKETVVDNLPGYATQIAQSQRDGFWVSFFSSRSAIFDLMQDSPFVKERYSSLPSGLRAPLPHASFVVEYDKEMSPLRSFHDDSGRRFLHVYGAVEHKNALLFVAPSNNSIGRLFL